MAAIMREHKSPFDSYEFKQAILLFPYDTKKNLQRKKKLLNNDDLKKNPENSKYNSK